jgi:hypothetical protein
MPYCLTLPALPLPPEPEAPLGAGLGEAGAPTLPPPVPRSGGRTTNSPIDGV